MAAAAASSTATAKDAAAETESKPSSKRGLIIGIAAVLVLGGGAAAFFLTRGDKEHTAAKAEPPAPAKYLPLDPPFVVNFQGDEGAKFLQVAMQLMTRDAEVEALLKEHDPQIRNDLLLLLSAQSATTLRTSEGKEKLRAQCLEAVRSIVKAVGGAPEKLEALYFTSFVMQ
ncbi:MAG: flagellar basal body-associated FliL family protein [Pseudomonadales bacterium]|nr:flagellar basal body-associated FliL family protein [Pseudomonadales bacterium]